MNKPLERAPNITAHLLQLLTSKTFAKTACAMYRIDWYDFRRITGKTRFSKEYMAQVRELMRMNGFQLIKIPDGYLVAHLDEIDEIRSPPIKLLKKYIINVDTNVDDNSISTEFVLEVLNCKTSGPDDKKNYGKSGKDWGLLKKY